MSSYDPSGSARGMRIADGSIPDGVPEGALIQTPMSKMGVHQIVRLRQMVQQWRRKAASNIGRTLQVMSPRRQKLLRGSTSSCGKSSSSSSSCGGGEHELPPEGYLAIYVGQERRRFVIRTQHINHPLLCGLLERTEEEFGLNQKGGLAIPSCEVVLFEHMLWLVENDDLSALDDPAELRELLDLYVHVSAAGGMTSCMQVANFMEAPSSNIHEPASVISSGYGRFNH